MSWAYGCVGTTPCPVRTHLLRCVLIEKLVYIGTEPPYTVPACACVACRVPHMVPWCVHVCAYVHTRAYPGYPRFCVLHFFVRLPVRVYTGYFGFSVILSLSLTPKKKVRTEKSSI